MTSCEYYIDLISEKTDGALSPAQEAELSSHLETCPDCRLRLQVFSALHGTDLTEEPPSDFTETVMKRIADESVAPKTGKSRFFRQISVLAAAAALFALVFLGNRAGLLSMFVQQGVSGSDAAPQDAQEFHVTGESESALFSGATAEDMTDDSNLESQAADKRDDAANSALVPPPAEDTENGAVSPERSTSDNAASTGQGPVASSAPTATAPPLQGIPGGGAKTNEPDTGSTTDVAPFLNSPQTHNEVPLALFREVENPFAFAVSAAYELPPSASETLVDYPTHMEENGTVYYLVPADHLPELTEAAEHSEELFLSAGTPADETADHVLVVLFPTE